MVDSDCPHLQSDQILETGSRVAKGLEHSWIKWTNIGVLVAFLQEVCSFFD